MRIITALFIAVPIASPIAACGERTPVAPAESAPAPVVATPAATAAVDDSTPADAPAAPIPSSPFSPAPAAPKMIPTPPPAIQRWCLVARGEKWTIAQNLSDDERKGKWFVVKCFGDIDWTQVDWDTMPAETWAPTPDDEPVPADRVTPLATCDLGVTPPEAAALFVPLPLPLKAGPPINPPVPATNDGPDETETVEAANEPANEAVMNPTTEATTGDTTAPRKKTPALVQAALPNPVAIAITDGDFGALLTRFQERVERVDRFDIAFEGAWRVDANQDGKDELFALYRGTGISPAGSDDDYAPHSSITEGFVWVDGRRPKHLIDFNINESSDHFDGLAACGLVDDPETGLVALALHDSGTFGDGDPDNLVIKPFDATFPFGSRTKPPKIEPWPVARVRNPSAPVLSRHWKGFDNFIGLRPGMKLPEVIQVLNSGRAPRLDADRVTLAADRSLTLASGPTLRFSSEGWLVGISIPSRAVARALMVRGFDHPLLDLPGQSARAVARAFAGARTGSRLFDGRVDKTTGVTLALNTNERDAVTSFDIQWYPLRRHLDADPTFAGMALGDALKKVPKELAADAVATETGWHIASAGLTLTMAEAADGIRRLAGLTVEALPTPAPGLSRDPILSLVGADAPNIIAALGQPDDGQVQSEATWLAPSPYRPAWSLKVTFQSGRAKRLTITAMP